MRQRAMDILIFDLGGRRFALPAEHVREIVRAVTLLPLPKAPAIVEGIFDLRGTVVPALDIRARFQLDSKPIGASDHLLVATAGKRVVALRIDRALELASVAERDVENATSGLPTSEYVTGVATLSDGLVLIHDLRTFLSAAESAALAGFLGDDANEEGR
jgi:purine-binding chemotaxis protein CheW